MKLCLCLGGASYQEAEKLFSEKLEVSECSDQGPVDVMLRRQAEAAEAAEAGGGCGG